MKYLLIILLVATVPKSRCGQMDIILMVDLSGSVTGHKQYVHSALYAFVDGFSLSDKGVRMSLITFNSNADVRYPLGSDKTALKNAVDNLPDPEGGTHMYKAFEKAGIEFDERGTNTTRIIILISDGSPMYVPQTIEIAKQLKQVYGATIFGVLIRTYDTNEEIMTEISSNNCYVATSYKALSYELSKLNLCL
jgi:uncharacterized protein with von Willebrand factor type A (vWA) domain